MTYVGTGKPSLAAGDYHALTQSIEGVRMADFGWGTAQARQAVLRFTVWGNIAGTYSVAIKNADASRTYLAPFTIASQTWTLVTLVIPGDITGTWPAGAVLGMYLTFGFASGTTFQGVAGWQAGNKTQIAGHTKAQPRG